MAYRIGRQEDVAEGLLRLLRADLDAARRYLRVSGRSADRIHRARRRLKRARTILRVLEPRFGEAAVATRRMLTEASRLMSRARDADVAVGGARALAEAEGANADLGFDRVVDTLEDAAIQANRQRTPIAEISSRLAAARRTVDLFDANFDGGALLARGLTRSYAKGRKALRRAETSLSTPDLHRWRKRVKDLWHLFLIARAQIQRKTRRPVKQLDLLAETLGSDNDHALLAEKLALSPTGDPQLMSQLGVIAQHRNALEADAFALGHRLYRRKPEEFSRRFKLR